MPVIGTNRPSLSTIFRAYAFFFLIVGISSTIFSLIRRTRRPNPGVVYY